METAQEKADRELRELVASQNKRLILLEDGFFTTHDTEGVHEQLRINRVFRKRAYMVAGAVVTGTIGIALKLLFL